MVTPPIQINSPLLSGVSEELKSYIIELPYEGESVSMFVLLPPFTPDALETTISRLSAPALRRAMDEMVHDSIEVLLPRFKLTSTIQLTSALSALGVKALFNQSASDLSDFSSKPGLAVEEAIHKSFIEVSQVTAPLPLQFMKPITFFFSFLGE